MISVLGVVERLSYPNWWRVLWPFNELRKHGYRADVCHYSDLRQQHDPRLYDVIVTPRLAVSGDHWFLDWIRHAERTWVYDADDDQVSPEWVERQVYAIGRDASRAERRRLAAEYERERKQRVRLMQRCNGVTVSTPELATLTEGTLVPNMIPIAWFEQKARLARRVFDGLTIGWAGGGRMESDIYPLPQAWSEIARMHPTVQFVIYGIAPQTLVDSVPVERLALLDWSPLQAYPAGLKNIDIMCCPLTDTLSNQCKSPIKWMEASISGAACVLSPVVYDAVVEHGRTGLIASTPEDWVIHLDTLVRDEAVRHGCASAANQAVRERHSLAEGWLAWPDTWAKWLE